MGTIGSDKTGESLTGALLERTVERSEIATLEEQIREIKVERSSCLFHGPPRQARNKTTSRNNSKQSSGVLAGNFPNSPRLEQKIEERRRKRKEAKVRSATL